MFWRKEKAQAAKPQVNTEVRFLDVPFQVLRLDPKDVIVLSHPYPLKTDAVLNLLRSAHKIFGDDRHIMVIEEGLKIGAVRED